MSIGLFISILNRDRDQAIFNRHTIRKTVGTGINRGNQSRIRRITRI